MPSEQRLVSNPSSDWAEDLLAPEERHTFRKIINDKLNINCDIAISQLLVFRSYLVLFDVVRNIPFPSEFDWTFFLHSV